MTRIALLAMAGMLLGAVPASADDQLHAEFFSDMALTQTAWTGEHPNINFNWPQGTAPAGLGDTFSARWTGQISTDYSEAYTFVLTRDDSVRLWVDGQLIVDDDWSVGHTGDVSSTPIALEAGRLYDLRLEFVEGGLDAEVRLAWESASQSRQVVPSSHLFAPAPEEEPPVLAPPAPGPGLPTEDAPPVPQAGRAVTLAPERGRLRVRVPGTTRFVALESLASVPVGSVVDARRGTARLRAEGKGGREQTVAAWGGVFKVVQSRRGKRMVTLSLHHRRGWCARRARARAAGDSVVQTSKRRRRSRIWARGKGRFRTRGRHGAATVRGTTWSVEDRCGATITRVKRGLVEVRDFAKRRNVLVGAGERYVARARSRR